MKKPVRIISVFLMVTTLLFLLSGCFSARIHMKIRANGSAEMEVVMSAPRAMMTLGTTAAMFGNIKDDLDSDGFAIEDFNGDKQVGFTALKEFASIDELSALSMGEDLLISDEPVVTVSKHFLTNTYHVHANIDLADILGENMDALTRLADIHFALTLPVSPREHNADMVSEDGKTLEWKLEAGASNPIEVTAIAPNVKLIIAGVLLILAAVATFIIALVLRRRGKDQEPQARA